MSCYHRLAQDERYQIEALLISGNSIRFIAKKLNRSPSTILREIDRNRPHQRHKYKGDFAHARSVERRALISPPLKITNKLKRFVVGRLKNEWSPEQICGRLKLLGLKTVSHETIYKFIYADFSSGGDLWKSLRKRRRYRRNRLSALRLKGIGVRQDRTWIEERPRIVEDRKRVGDFERDTMVGQRGGAVLLTIVDRTSRLTKIRWMARLDAKQTHRETVLALRKLKVETLTNDNGPEFTLHRATQRAFKAPVYFCRPYSSWQRGTNENTNGLLRQYFPRRIALNQSLVKHAENRLNNRPRKCLGYKTPLEVHRKLMGVALRF